ncbi:hypothetical protein QOT17_014895 [Balamuthia mandrillaris]
MTEQPSEAQKIGVLKRCLNPCLLESVSNVLLSQNAEKYDQAVQIALSIKLIFMHTRLPLVPAVLYTQHPDIQQLNMKDGTQTPSKANTGQHHNGNNYGSSSSSSSSSGHPVG